MDENKRYDAEWKEKVSDALIIIALASPLLSFGGIKWSLIGWGGMFVFLGLACYFHDKHYIWPKDRPGYVHDSFEHQETLRHGQVVQWGDASFLDDGVGKHHALKCGRCGEFSLVWNPDRIDSFICKACQPHISFQTTKEKQDE